MKWLLRPNLSMFDLITVSTMSVLIANTDNLWWLLIAVPQSFISGFLERRVL